MSSLKGVLLVCAVLVVQVWWIHTMMSNCTEPMEPTSWSADLVYKLENGYEQQLDPQLADFIYQRWIVSPPDKKLALKKPQVIDRSQVGQASFVDKLLAHKTRGFYVECGAANGEAFSNSLFFERFRSWEGLLIEASPFYFREILQTNRKAFSINTCLSTSNSSQKVEFIQAGLFGGLEANMDDTHLIAVNTRSKVVTQVQCFTLASVLLALNQKHVDYFSLDVEGAELEILATIPWQVIHIDVISVEYRSSDGRSIDETRTSDKLQRVRRFFQQLGLYEEVGILPWGSHDNEERKESKGLDVFFKHK